MVVLGVFYTSYSMTLPEWGRGIGDSLEKLGAGDGGARNARVVGELKGRAFPSTGSCSNLASGGGTVLRIGRESAPAFP
ncbi:hypothetical protein CEXT_13581 [Caerostris extrusa]|uniref:Uncharacterized protein n=1 Tax=Caerostris extrusa TaxID=172846 RepID=A0AAV4YA80_CAEEX|nr:hypothetical protein CEXT_13581 [Caerostris extrusa]